MDLSTLPICEMEHWAIPLQHQWQNVKLKTLDLLALTTATCNLGDTNLETSALAACNPEQVRKSTSLDLVFRLTMSQGTTKDLVNTISKDADGRVQHRHHFCALLEDHCSIHSVCFPPIDETACVQIRDSLPVTTLVDQMLIFPLIAKADSLTSSPSCIMF